MSPPVGSDLGVSRSKSVVDVGLSSSLTWIVSDTNIMSKSSFFSSRTISTSLSSENILHASHQLHKFFCNSRIKISLSKK
jgi:hypothetical protein